MQDISRRFKQESGGKVSDFPTMEKKPALETTEACRCLDRMSLNVDCVEGAAYFINSDFQIEWINEAAERELFNQSVISIEEIDERNIFKMLFGWEFHDSVENWRDIITFHMGFAKRFIQRGSVDRLYRDMTAGEKDCLLNAYDESTEVPENGVVERALEIRRKNGEVLNYAVYTVYFREGLFFVYDRGRGESQAVKTLLSRREDVIQELMAHRMPSLLSLCVLVADLQDSVRISVELPPSEYFELINGLWHTLGRIFDSHNAICGKHAGDGLLYYFVKKPGTNHIMEALKCALSRVFDLLDPALEGRNKFMDIGALPVAELISIS